MYTRIYIVVIVGLLVAGGVAVTPAVTQPSVESTANSASVEIDSTLQSTSGTQTVIVRLTEPPNRELQATNHDTRIDAMQSHAADSQSAFERFADGTPHVEIDQRFWLTNAMVVTVDTDRVPLDRLGLVDNVERIHANHEVNALGTATAPPTPTHSTGPPQAETDRTSFRSATSTTQSIADVDATTEASSTTSLNTPNTVGSMSTGGTNFTRALEVIGVPTAWETFDHRGDGVRVAVLDTGVNPDHPDININNNNWVCEIDCTTTGPHDVHGHGTHVSGTVVGSNHNDVGLQIGVAPDATLMHAKVLGNDGNGNFDSVLNGMQWAVTNDADVISMSLGAQIYDDVFIDAVRNAQDSGTIVVAASGNAGSDTAGTPANVYDATAVGSVDIEPAFPDDRSFGLHDDTVSDSSGGKTVDKTEWDNPPAEWPDSYVVPDVTAPGSVIWSADTDYDTATCGSIATDDLTCQQGTSMATPHVAGTVALMLSNSYVDRSPNEINTALRTTAVDIGAAETRQGAGRINATAAVAAVETRPNIVVDITAAPTTVTAGRQLTGSYTIKNTGNEPGDQLVTVQIDDEIIESTSTGTLDPGDTINNEFTYQNTSTKQGRQTLTVESNDDSASQPINIVEPTVKLTNVSLDPATVTDGTAADHTLTFDVLNVSDDGQQDTFTVTLPPELTLTTPITDNNVTATDTTGKQINISATSHDNEITFTTSPDTDVELRDLTIKSQFTAQTSSQNNETT